MRSFFPAVVALMAAGFSFYSHREKPLAAPVALSAAMAQASPTALDKEFTRAVEALQVLRTAPRHGLEGGKYNQSTIEGALARVRQSDDAADRAQQLADLKAETHRALLAFAHDVAIGRVSPAAVDPNWKSRRVLPDLADSLDQFANRPLEQWIADLQPRHPEYAALQRALQQLRDQAQKDGWPKVPVHLLRLGSSDPAVAILRERLAASGELKSVLVSDAATYDQDVEAAVKTFQEHHGMKATGVTDQATIAAMNVPLGDRIRQVEVNLERWRWMPNDFGARHFLVNIPAFQLMAREDGRTVSAMRVIVGKPGHETPVFSGDMETVVFSPYWNVPESIAEGETAPAAAGDPDYLARNQIEILRHSKSGTKVVDESDVNWFDPDDLNQLSFRQRPGAKNALGHVKFLFPNAFNVYLHDTPTGSLFARTQRAFSHGCVRVEQPEALAAYVLRDRSEWTTEHIKSAMDAGVEKYVKLDEMIPVHIVYFTTWVDESGGLYFLPDVYGYDVRQARLAR